MVSIKLLKNKDLVNCLIGLLLMSYLYLDTPFPMGIKLGKLPLVVCVLLALYLSYYLFKNVNIFISILFVLVAYEVIKKSAKVDKNNINKNTKFYNSPPTSENIISEKLKKPYTLEQEMVDKMVPVVKHSPKVLSPRYQALLPDLTGTSSIDHDGLL
jgi:hypothetical protein